MRGLIATVLVGTLLGTACRPQPAVVVPPPTSTALIDRLSPGDLFEVRVFGEEDLGGVYQVGEDGSITFPLVGKVEVVGRTGPEVSAVLRDRLADGFLRDPHVTVMVKERQNRDVTVLGQVAEPGSFAYRDRLTLVQVLSLAGGLTPMAAPRRIRLTRQTADGRQTFEVSLKDITEGEREDLPLQPGDIVFVPESPI